VRDSWIVNILYAIPLGVVAGVVGLVGVVLLAVGRSAGDAVAARLSSPRCPHLGLLATPVIGGVLYGLIAVAFPLTLGDGASQLGVIIKDAFASRAGGGELSAGFCLLLALAKMLALGVCLGFGFVGGQIFPLMFAGASVGAGVVKLVGRSAKTRASYDWGL